MNCSTCGRFMKKVPRYGLSPLEQIENGGPFEWVCARIVYDGDDGGIRTWAHL